MKLPYLVHLTPEMQRAQVEYELPLKIQNYRIACILGIVFMPFGALLDYFIYPAYLEFFFWLRLECSVLLGMILWLLGMPFGRKYHRPLGMIEVILPIFFIAWMIYETEGVKSGYYAGINIVLVGVGFLMRWGFADSTRMVLIAIFIYLGACLLSPWGPSALEEKKDLVNSLYFITLTGIFSITGNYLYNLIRTREFALRWELDVNRRQLESNNRKLKELDRVKNRFFANISHELRTPLTLLLTPLESLITKGHQRFPPEVMETLHSMQANGMRLLKLINDLLELVRLESGRMKVMIKPLHLEPYLKGIVSSVSKAASDRGIRVETHVQHPSLTIHTDRDKLEKVLLNLIFNAIKFTSPGGSIRISAIEEDHWLSLQIEDTGIGIPEESLKFIFDRFWQVDNSSKRKHQGVGIGLALVKEFVELLKGDISVESSEGKGTRFLMRMPLAFPKPSPQDNDTGVTVTFAKDESDDPARPNHDNQVPREGLSCDAEPVSDEKGRAMEKDDQTWLANLYRRAELLPAASLEPPRIGTDLPLQRQNRPLLLIADDEPDMLKFLLSQLADHYEVLEANDGQEAIEKARQFLPDVIVLDMMMPEKDGLQVCQALRSNTSTENIPIILLTARADEAVKLSALQAGASDFLTKPFSLAEIHVRLKNLSDAYRYQRTLARQKQKLEATLDQLAETETQLVQSEKMASLGKMSAGILHEINNPLNFAKTGAYTLRAFSVQLPKQEQEDYNEIVRDVEEGITRVSQIVQDLRGFSHPNAEKLHEVFLETVVSKSLRLVSNEVKHFEVKTELDADLAIMGNENQVIQLLVNLLHNASDSLDAKDFCESSVKPCITILGEEKGDRIHLLIRDNGTGIEDSHLVRIFDPFYTTKDVGKGMGLGLSICYKIMEHHQGTIKVNTKPDHFTEFDLEFPVSSCNL